MSGRALAFSDPEIIKMATHDYVSVAADDWYQRRRTDAEGEFFRRVADQGPRKGEGGATRQGIYCLTADGKLLAYKNAGQAPDVMRDTLEQGLRAWRKLPEARRKPGAVKVDGARKTDPQYDRKPPAGGLILNVYTRILERDGTEYRRGTCSTKGGEKAARDHMWITEKEWKAIVAPTPRRGARVELPPAIVERILRFHLTDNTRGEPPMWRREDLRKREMTLNVEDVSDQAIEFRLEGSALLATAADVDKADRGFDVRVLGRIRFDRLKRAIDRFDVVAVGDHWGEGTYTRGARPGRQALGIVFELAVGKNPADRLPPQAAREDGAYFGR